MTAVIRLEDIMKTYVMGDAVVHALDHVSVEIGVGEFTSIMGPSGSGKSTMMNILGCLDRPTSDNIIWMAKKSPAIVTMNWRVRAMLKSALFSRTLICCRNCQHN